jgi:cobalt-zinc-cadmium efflux system protein
MAVAAVGLVLNLGIGLTLMGHAEDNLNVRSAFLHVMGDAAASAGVILGAVAIYFTKAQWIDPALSVAIALFIAYGAWSVLEECLHILMESVPRDLDMKALVADLKGVQGVQDVHDLHVWSISQGMTSLSCHLLLDEEHIQHSISVVNVCNQLLAHRYKIEHTTIQAEAEHCSPDSPHCNLAFVQPAHAHHGHDDHDHHDHDHHDHHDHDHHDHHDHDHHDHGHPH